MGGYDQVGDHRSMVTDFRRALAYRRALERVVTPASVVVDVGAGTGVLGLMAAQAGAAHVHLIEPAGIVGVAADLAATNGLADRVTIHHCGVDEAEIDCEADLLVSAMTGNLVVTENLLPELFKARDRFLRTGGVMLPDSAELRVAPVEAPLTREALVDWPLRPVAGLDLSPLHPYLTNSVHVSHGLRKDVRLLAEPETCFALDLTTASDVTVDHGASSRASSGGELHGWAAWLRISLGGTDYETGPGNDPTHWRPGLFPTHEPIPVLPGSEQTLQLHRSSRADWNWSIGCGEHEEHHSGLLAAPIVAGAFGYDEKRT